MSPLSVLIRWSPRLLAILYAQFLSLFAFDSWEGVGFWEGLAAFIVHLLPVYLVAFVLVVAWRWRALGGVLFIALAAGFALAFGWREATTLLLLGLPPVVIGGLFLLDSYVNERRLQPRY